ncbi:hypothetical protein [Streptomyces malaysiensis]|uniref:hypothetical protein n=1 Tax=Streptomyces malaysiensis TaxID=92644 RepID=UPI0035580402
MSRSTAHHSDRHGTPRTRRTPDPPETARAPAPPDAHQGPDQPGTPDGHQGPDQPGTPDERQGRDRPGASRGEDARTAITVFVALGANLLIALAKAVGGVFSGSPALLSEAAHSGDRPGPAPRAAPGPRGAAGDRHRDQSADDASGQ